MYDIIEIYCQKYDVRNSLIWGNLNELSKKLEAYQNLLILQDVLNEGYEFEDNDYVWYKEKNEGTLTTVTIDFCSCSDPCFNSKKLLNHAYKIGKKYFDIFYGIE